MNTPTHFLDRNETGRHRHKWDELYMDEFFAEMERAPIVYWTPGLPEDHGTHLALGTDLIPTYKVCLAAAEITGGVVYPPVPFAPGGNPPHSRLQLRSRKSPSYPPSLFCSRELCRAAYTELMENMASLGFKVCVALGGHGPAITMLQTIAEQENHGSIGGMRVLTPNWVDELLKHERWSVFCAENPRAKYHAGILESALVNATCPGWCDLAKADDVRTAEFDSQVKLYFCKPEERDGFNYLAEIAKKATPELGREVFDDVVADLVKAVTREKEATS